MTEIKPGKEYIVRFDEGEFQYTNAGLRQVTGRIESVEEIISYPRSPDSSLYDVIIRTHTPGQTESGSRKWTFDYWHKSYISGKWTNNHVSLTWNELVDWCREAYDKYSVSSPGSGAIRWYPLDGGGSVEI